MLRAALLLFALAAIAAAQTPTGTTQLTAVVTENLYVPKGGHLKHRRFNLIVYQLPVDPNKIDVSRLMVGALGVNDSPMESPGTGMDVVVPNTFACRAKSDLAVGNGDSFGPVSPCNYGDVLEIQPDLRLLKTGAKCMPQQIVIRNPARDSMLLLPLLF